MSPSAFPAAAQRRAALGVWPGVACSDAAEAVAPGASVAAAAPAAVELAALSLTPGPAEATVAVAGQGNRDIAVWMPEGPGPQELGGAAVARRDER